MRREMPRLPPAERRAVWRTQAEDETCVEAARALGIAAGTARKLVCQGVGRLRKRLEAHELS